MQYKTTKTAQRVAGGGIYLGNDIFILQAIYPRFHHTAMNPDVPEILLGC